MVEYLLPFVTGLVFLAAGLYQFRAPRLGGLRIVGIIDSDIDTDDVSEEESVFAKLVGVGLIMVIFLTRRSGMDLTKLWSLIQRWSEAATVSGQDKHRFLL